MKKYKRFQAWLYGESDVMDNILELDETSDETREQQKREIRHIRREIRHSRAARSVVRAEQKGFYYLYNVVAVVSCIFLIGVLLFAVSNLPRFGEENPRTTEMVGRYVEHGVEETGAVNIVAGLILDYRAFDTLGESHVLFTALICVTILLRLDRKNTRKGFEDYYAIRGERFHDISKEAIMRNVAAVLVPCIFLFGIYVLLNGQNGPGGGFSGGAVIGAGMIIFSAAFGFDLSDRVFTKRLTAWVTFGALTFYSMAKGYVFFTGANHLENHIPKGTPGAILSGGLILPLDIAVGLVVAFTMFGFYSLFVRGSVGERGDSR